MNYLKMSLSICLIILSLAGIAGGMLMLNKPSNSIPLIGIFVIFGSIGFSLFNLKLLWRKREKKIDIGDPGPIPVDDSRVRKPH